MNKILFDKENSLAVKVAQKCMEKLPSWEDFSRSIPFIITGSVALSFVLMSRAEHKRQQERQSQYFKKQFTQEQQNAGSEEKKSEQPQKQNEEEEEKIDQSETGSKANVALYQSQTEEKNGQISKQRYMKKNYNGNNKKNNQQHYSGSNDENDSDAYKKQQNQNNHYLNSSDYDFFNCNRYSQNEDEEDECFDKVTNVQPSENSNQQMKAQTFKEKRQKRAPIKINKNFATDSENNEKFQKLKSIIQKEKKIEDKVFFQIFQNIVGTEAEEDNDD